MLPKLITGLNTLSKENWRQFTKYLLMYVREQSAPHKLLVLLDKNQQRLPSFDSAKWHQKYMPDISEKAWLNNLSRLYSYLEEYIVHQNFRSDKIRSGIELVKHWNRIILPLAATRCEYRTHHHSATKANRKYRCRSILSLSCSYI